ncbi:hypothetical protein BST83_18105 [Polaribacter filamentus]|uniref:Uncharacterized protein n=1 Tax=Polaribacter filamentus TaxID=53483 RepID=A0A2S7KKR9_9FLAO|nr:hypothetical protein [Polaribacter filamentus]PQB03224.1 hypothetical protein BST83_18105 [Polaribacter filamentus]
MLQTSVFFQPSFSKNCYIFSCFKSLFKIGIVAKIKAAMAPASSYFGTPHQTAVLIGKPTNVTPETTKMAT